jgi:hypothetical protein
MGERPQRWGCARDGLNYSDATAENMRACSFCQVLMRAANPLPAFQQGLQPLETPTRLE